MAAWTHGFEGAPANQRSSKKGLVPVPNDTAESKIYGDDRMLNWRHMCAMRRLHQRSMFQPGWKSQGNPSCRWIESIMPLDRPTGDRPRQVTQPVAHAGPNATSCLSAPANPRHRSLSHEFYPSCTNSTSRHQQYEASHISTHRMRTRFGRCRCSARSPAPLSG